MCGHTKVLVTLAWLIVQRGVHHMLSVSPIAEYTVSFTTTVVR